MPVTLINVFSVPAAKEAEFVQWWQDVKEHITPSGPKQEGVFHQRHVSQESQAG